MTPIRIVTVSREFGAGGGDFARELGTRLGWPVLDRDLVHRVATRLRMDDETIESFDEHPPGLLAKIARLLVIPQNDVYDFPPLEDIPWHDSIAAASTREIREAAAAPPLVVVGHGAPCILAGRPDTLHVFLYAPLETRVRRLAGRFPVPVAALPELANRADRERQVYVQRYFHVDWRQDALYGLKLDTARVPIAVAVALAERIVRDSAGAAAEAAAPTQRPEAAPLG